MQAHSDSVNGKSSSGQPDTKHQSALAKLDSDRFFFVVLILGLIVRAIVFTLLVPEPICDDAVDYQADGLKLAEGQRISLYWPPGLPHYLALFYRLFHYSEFVSRLAMIPTYIVLATAVFLIGQEMAGTRVGNLSTLMISFYPTFVHLSLEPLTQMLTAALLACVALAALKVIRKESWRWATLLGLALGALTLTRPSSLALCVLVPLFLVLRTRSILRSLLPILLSSALIGAWVYKTYENTGHFVWINYANSKNIYLGNNPHTPLYRTWWFGSHFGEESGSPEFNEALREITSSPLHERDALFKTAAVDHIKSRPDLFVLRTLNRIRCFYAFDTLTGSYTMKWYDVPKPLGLLLILVDAAFYMAVVVLALAGLVVVLKDKAKIGDVLLLAGITVVYAAPYWLSFSHPVYHFPVMPLLAVLASTAFVHLLRPGTKVREILARHRLYFGVVLMLLAYIQAEWVWVMRARLG